MKNKDTGYRDLFVTTMDHPELYAEWIRKISNPNKKPTLVRKEDNQKDRGAVRDGGNR